MTIKKHYACMYYVIGINSDVIVRAADVNNDVNLNKRRKIKIMTIMLKIRYYIYNMIMYSEI